MGGNWESLLTAYQIDIGSGIFLVAKMYWEMGKLIVLVALLSNPLTCMMCFPFISALNLDWIQSLRNNVVAFLTAWRRCRPTSRAPATRVANGFEPRERRQWHSLTTCWVCLSEFDRKIIPKTPSSPQHRLPKKWVVLFSATNIYHLKDPWGGFTRNISIRLAAVSGLIENEHPAGWYQY